VAAPLTAATAARRCAHGAKGFPQRTFRPDFTPDDPAHARVPRDRTGFTCDAGRARTIRLRPFPARCPDVTQTQHASGNPASCVRRRLASGAAGGSSGSAGGLSLPLSPSRG
jgi:hypothetical protein